jgi:hypothetical protein
MPVQFVNVAREAGLRTKNIFGGEKRNKYLLETTAAELPSSTSMSKRRHCLTQGLACTKTLLSRAGRPA